MAQIPEPTITVYRDLESATDFTHSWLPEFTFNVDRVSLTQSAALRALAGVRVHFDDVRWDVSGFAADFLMASRRENLLIAIEHKSSTRSRVRSHKGLFAKYSEIRAGDFDEFEIAIAGEYTHLIGVVAVTRSNAAECAALMGDGSRFFVISSKTQLPRTLELAETVRAAVPDLPGPAYVNYAEIVAKYCPHGSRVIRMGGYSGDGDADLQVFTSKPDVGEVVAEIRSNLRLAEI